MSRGGLTTKAVVAADSQGRALAFALLPGQTAELRTAPILLERVRALGRLGRVVCDRAYSSKGWHDLIAAKGSDEVVPANRTHPQVAYSRPAYRRRHRVENLWARLETRAVAFRFEKTAASYKGNLQLAAALDWLSNGP